MSRAGQGTKIGKIVQAAVVTLVSVVVIVGGFPASPASAKWAIAAGCDTQFRYYPGYFGATCSSGPGVFFRARFSCKSSPTSNVGVVKRGPWVQEGTGTWSVANCSSDRPYAATSGTVEWS